MATPQSTTSSATSSASATTAVVAQTTAPATASSSAPANSSSSSSSTRPARGPRESIFDFEKYMDKQIRVKFLGGREVVGVLKGFDQLVNLVLDECIEYIKEPTESTRSLGLLVCRGPNVASICPEDGMAEIPNPFASAEGEE